MNLMSFITSPFITRLFTRGIVFLCAFADLSPCLFPMLLSPSI